MSKVYHFKVSGGSANMEPYACKTVLLSLVSCGLNIKTFTTDRSSSIRTMLQNCPEFSNVEHEFDPWHWISKYFFIYIVATINIANFQNV